MVLDASATLAAYLRDERSLKARDLFARAGEIAFHVPSIWKLEVTNGLLVACRRRRIEMKHVEDVLRRLDTLDIWVDTPADLARSLDLLQIADRYELSIYDAAYFELAARLGTQLATLDTKLTRAALRGNVDLAIQEG